MAIAVYRGFKEKAFPYLLLLPAFIIAGIVLFYPLINGMLLSLTSYSLLSPKYEWVGFRNYVQLFQDPVYWEVFKNSFMIVLPSVACQLLVGLLTALLLNTDLPFRNFFRSAIFIIWVLPGMARALLWVIIYNPDVGILNYLLRSIGIIQQNLSWLGTPGFAKLAIMLIYTWSGVPFFMVMLLAALQTIPDDIVEASKIDGAGAFRRFIAITLPYIMGVTGLCCLLSIVRLFQDVTLIYILTAGGPLYDTTTFAMHVYKYAFQSFEMGPASAVGITWMVILMFIAAIYIKQVTKRQIN